MKGGVGGNMLTFLVLLPLHVCYAAQMSGSVASLYT